MGPQETPRSTLTKENAPAGGISPGTTVLAVRRESAPCSAGSQCTSSATRSLTWAALVFATTSSHSQEKATPASPTTPILIVPGATRTVGNASKTQSLALTQRREVDAKQGRTRSTAPPSKGIASTSATVTPMLLARRRLMLASLDSIGSANVTRDILATESNVWTATAHSAPCQASKLRLPSL